VSAILLDTHALLWFLFDDLRLSPRAAAAIEERAMTKLVSVVSLWEIVIKCQLGKLSLGMPTDEFFERHVTERELGVVDIELAHLLAYEGLPLHHRDPFDRLIIAQAKELEAPVVTADPSFAAYAVQTLW